MNRILKGICLLLVVGLVGGCCPMPYQPSYIMADKAPPQEKETVTAETLSPSKALNRPSPNRP